MSQPELAALQNPSMAGVLEHVVGRWGAVLISVGLAVSLLGALLSWALLCAEILFVAAKDGTMPAFLRRESANKVPANALWLTNAMIQLFLLIILFAQGTYLSLIYLASSMILVPYLWSSVYALLLVVRGETYGAQAAVRRKDLLVGLLAILYAAWLLYAGGVKPALRAVAAPHQPGGGRAGQRDAQGLVPGGRCGGGAGLRAAGTGGRRSWRRAGAELARRLAAVGNFSKLQQAEQQGFYAEAGIAVLRAEQARVASRERLTRLLGLWGEQIAYRLPERLPPLPDAADELPEVERLAMSQRQDIQAMRLDVERLAQNLGLTRTTRFVNVLELGVVNNRSNEEPAQRGYEISVELPLFDWSGAKVARAEAQYRQALNRAAETAINARSQVREAYQAYRNAFELARHYR
ncbi:UNVERIFIED_CONTAM: arcD, partial [Trichonephila clavipes]